MVTNEKRKTGEIQSGINCYRLSSKGISQIWEGIPGPSEGKEKNENNRNPSYVKQGKEKTTKIAMPKKSKMR